MKKSLRGKVGSLFLSMMLLSSNISGLALAAETNSLPNPEQPVVPMKPQISYGPYQGAISGQKHAYEPFKEKTKTELKGLSYKKDQVLVKLESGSTGGIRSQSMESSFEDQGVLRLDPVFPASSSGKVSIQGFNEAEQNLAKWYRATLEKGTDVLSTVEALEEQPGVLAAEPDYLRGIDESLSEPSNTDSESESVESLTSQEIKSTDLQPATVESVTEETYAIHSLELPTDEKLIEQPYLEKVGVTKAWEYLQQEGLNPGGSRDVVVAVIDTGVDYLHPDLQGNMWVNTGEIAGNNVDDDGNGFIDDIHGASTVGNRYAGESGNPMDDHGHGTHVAGIIAAQANNGAGGSGVAYNTQIMAIKAAQSSGILSSSDVAEAIYYAVEKGADVINMSFGGYGRSIIEEDALQVAFGTAVLVAAAGNDAKPNLPHPFGADMYPASYPWVLGVMAERQSAASNGDNLASFSNWDYQSEDSHEYEVMAPGEEIFSTLPNGQYAKWSGTSMATPVVSGIAALLRSKFSDKESYSSRFIMGQLAATGPVKQGITYAINKPPAEYHEINAYEALTNTPKPKLSYLEHYVFDTKEVAEENDGDGVIDAGETVDLAMVIRNHWGKADSVQVKMDTKSPAGIDDPYVTFLSDTVDYGAVGNFAIDDNGLIYENDMVTGVNKPFQLKVSSNTPNDHVIPIHITITGKNGLDTSDSTEYVYQDSFNLVVRRGKELPRIISQDMTLTKDDYWIISDRTLIEKGVTVRVEPGTQIQFWSTDPSDPYAEQQIPYLQVEGNLLVNGTADEPVEMFPGALYPGHAVKIMATYDINFGGYSLGGSLGGNAELNYVKITNPYLSVTKIDHSYFTQDLDDRIYVKYTYENEIRTDYSYGPLIRADEILNSRFYRLGINPCNCDAYIQDYYRLRMYGKLFNNLFDSSMVGFKNPNYNYGIDQLEEAQGNVFLKNYKLSNTNWGERVYWGSQVENMGSQLETENKFRNNAILNTWWDPNINHWLRFVTSYNRDYSLYIPNNFWGTASTTLIGKSIQDYNDDFNKAKIIYEPILTTAPVTAYPFVTDIYVSTESEERATKVGAEPITVHVTFNRDMDQTVQPQVSFGPDMPTTDYTVNAVDGGWKSPRQWVGQMNITPLTGDGYQFFRVDGAVAGDDPWLVTGNDTERFRFEIVTSGTEAMNLQASGAEGKVLLSWTQDDFDLLAGYNLYRSESPTGEFTRMNSSIIPAEQKSYEDQNVQPGKTYYYKFTVVKTDLTESKFSNVAAGTPLDTIAPVILHEPVKEAAVGLNLQIYADVTDNVKVDKVTLYYRKAGTAEYSKKDMVKSTGNRYTATLEGALMQAPGIDYYLEASDGISTVKNGTADTPNKISITDAPKMTSVTPAEGPESGGTAVIIAGTNFKPGASVTFGNAVASNVTVESANRIKAVSPSHFPSTVDVTVTNSDGYKDTMLRSFTYKSEGVQLTIANVNANRGQIVEVPVSLSEVSGLRSANFKLTYDASLLKVKNVRRGTLTSNSAMAFNSQTAGIVQVSLANATAISGSGTLAYVEFEVLNGDTTSTALKAEDVQLNSGSIAVNVTNGTFQVSATYSVQGNISYYSNWKSLEGVTLNLKGEKSYSATSHSNGAYNLIGVEKGSYTLTASKENEATAISAYDASLILQASVGLISLSDYQRIAADVDHNQQIDAMDAAYVLEKAVDLLELPFPGAGKVWTFAPIERSVSTLNGDLQNENFTAILIGDVSGNWGSTQDVIVQSLQNQAQFTFETVRAESGSQASVPLSFNVGYSQLYSAEVEISYDAQKVKALSVEKTELADSFNMAVNLDTPGKAKIAIAGTTPLTGSGTLLKINFQASKDMGVKTAIEASKMMINEVTASSVQNGNIIVSISGDADLNNRVDDDDLRITKEKYGKRDAEKDFTGDGLIDLFDLIKINKNQGKTSQ